MRWAMRVSSPSGREMASISRRSSGLKASAGEAVRQNSGMSVSIDVASAVTGHETLAVWRPAACADDQRVGDFICSEYQYHAPESFRSGSKRVLLTMLCLARQTP